MHLLFTRHMKIARCYRFLSGLWFKHKKDCKEVAVCSIGMEVVMSEEKKIVTHWEHTFLKTSTSYPHYMNFMRKQAYSHRAQFNNNQSTGV